MLHLWAASNPLQRFESRNGCRCQTAGCLALRVSWHSVNHSPEQCRPCEHLPNENPFAIPVARSHGPVAHVRASATITLAGRNSSEIAPCNQADSRGSPPTTLGPTGWSLPPHRLLEALNLLPVLQQIRTGKLPFVLRLPRPHWTAERDLADHKQVSTT